ncbi:aspartate/glutamate racemase family protein [Craurococcus roseus]|uniref:Aspartate/glutamate racemase family protein n=1 Tax=Craurococcus roseus TaxID=77585 RepID=A0ABN1F9Y8_9PROT
MIFATMQRPARVLVINPNNSTSCTDGIAAALRPLASGAARFDVVRLPEGPPAVASWADWFAVAEPLRRLVAREEAAAYVIACVSDPGLDAVREATRRPVLGMLRCAIAAALARGAERFGIIGFADASLPRQRRVLQAMGVEARLSGWEPLNLPMETLTDPVAPRGRIAAAARALAAGGAEAVVLGCAGLAGHTAAAENGAGVPVVEPCRAAGAMALLAALDDSSRGADAA